MISNSVIQQAVSTGAIPAGGRVIYTNSSGIPVNIISIIFQYNATATVGTRTPNVLIKDSLGNTLYQNNAGLSITASGAAVPNVGPGMNNSGQFCLPIPAYLGSGSQVIVVDTSHIDANDTISSGQIVVQF